MLSTCNQRTALSLFHVSLGTSPVCLHRRATPIRRMHPRMMAMSMAQCCLSIPAGAPGLVTRKSSTLVPSTILTTEKSAGCMSLCFPNTKQKTLQQRIAPSTPTGSVEPQVRNNIGIGGTNEVSEYQPRRLLRHVNWESADCRAR